MSYKICHSTTSLKHSHFLNILNSYMKYKYLNFLLHNAIIPMYANVVMPQNPRIFFLRLPKKCYVDQLLVSILLIQDYH